VFEVEMVLLVAAVIAAGVEIALNAPEHRRRQGTVDFAAAAKRWTRRATS
jgi:hypothetical protein